MKPMSVLRFVAPSSAARPFARGAQGTKHARGLRDRLVGELPHHEHAALDGDDLLDDLHAVAVLVAARVRDVRVELAEVHVAVGVVLLLLEALVELDIHALPRVDRHRTRVVVDDQRDERDEHEKETEILRCPPPRKMTRDVRRIDGLYV